MATNEIANRIRNFIIHNFLFDDAASMPDDGASLLEHGIIDSTGILDVIMALETDFVITVADEDVIPENFDSVDNLTAYVKAKLADIAA